MSIGWQHGRCPDWRAVDRDAPCAMFLPRLLVARRCSPPSLPHLSDSAAMAEEAGVKFLEVAPRGDPNMEVAKRASDDPLDLAATPQSKWAGEWGRVSGCVCEGWWAGGRE